MGSHMDTDNVLYSCLQWIRPACTARWKKLLSILHIFPASASHHLASSIFGLMIYICHPQGTAGHPYAPHPAAPPPSPFSFILPLRSSLPFHFYTRAHVFVFNLPTASKFLIREEWNNWRILLWGWAHSLAARNNLPCEFLWYWAAPVCFLNRFITVSTLTLRPFLQHIQTTVHPHVSPLFTLHFKSGMGEIRSFSSYITAQMTHRSSAGGNRDT